MGTHTPAPAGPRRNTPFPVNMSEERIILLLHYLICFYLLSRVKQTWFLHVLCLYCALCSAYCHLFIEGQMA